ncbi:hypothetical protein GALL_497810 [mine drainage metagenome]|uniref:Fibronectin type-III domain-containing protein n=1 Tax=mine drainage metagenome TaxID=410659 RepID=A0A1J5PAH9_9ZZZZ
MAGIDDADDAAAVSEMLATVNEMLAKKPVVKRAAKKAVANRKVATKAVAATASASMPTNVTIVEKDAIESASTPATVESAAPTPVVETPMVETPVVETDRVDEVVEPSAVSAAQPIFIDAEAALASDIDLSFLPNFDATTVPETLVVKRMRVATRVLFAVVGALVVVGLVLWAKANGPAASNAAGATVAVSASPSAASAALTTAPTASATPTYTPTTVASATATPTKTPTATPTATAATTSASTTVAGHTPPLQVVAQYTSTGAAIYWKAPTSTAELTGYTLQTSVNGATWAVIAKVPATKESVSVTKTNSSGWTSFRVSSVYSDGKSVAGKAFGLPGLYS